MKRAKVTSTLVSDWLPKTLGVLDDGVNQIAEDIIRRGAINAPKDSGDLANTGKVVKVGEGRYYATFGSNSVRYARVREYTNKKNPQTTGYLERAGDSIKRGDTTKYFRKKI